MDGQFAQAAKAVDTADYRYGLIICLEDLRRTRVKYLNHLGKVSEDMELTRDYICMLVTVMDELLPKLKGGGTKWADTVKEFEAYQPWSDNILTPLNNTKELEKVHGLHRLIVKTYDLLNISNI
jgi:hypothetical protein